MKTLLDIVIGVTQAACNVQDPQNINVPHVQQDYIYTDQYATHILARGQLIL